MLGRVNLHQVLFEFIAVFCAVFLVLLGIQNLSSSPLSIYNAINIASLIGFSQVNFHAFLGGYSSSWRFFSYQDGKIALTSVVIAVFTVAVVLYSAVPIVGWIMVFCTTILGVIGLRLLIRIANSHDFLLIKSHRRIGQKKDLAATNSHQKLLMIGFGDHVADFIRLQNKPDSSYEIVGIVHVKSECEAKSLRGIPIIGSVNKLGSIIRRLSSDGKRPDHLVLTRDEMNSHSIGEILSITDKFDIPVAWLPRTDQISSSPGQQLRQIKLDDLLPRSTNHFDAQACGNLLNGSTVLVTGAGGSIGSELVRQISHLVPKTLILTDASEHALYTINQEISRVFPNLNIISKLLDVRDRGAVFRALEHHRPNYVFHAAALKHVPIVEAQACEGVITNVLGSRNIADASAAAQVDAMIMVSTDKAVNPANVMGATKRLAEMYCQAMDASNADIKGVTRYVTVRFGNVLGSNGSVVPLFQKQMAQGGPLTVTHPHVERFFMTIPEASRLILQALLIGMNDQGGDRGIFVLDMGASVKIDDLARQVIRLSGLTPEKDVKIVYTGLRAGEKLYEELMHETENLVQTEHPSLMIASPRFALIQTVRSQVDVIQSAANAGNTKEVLRLLKLYIPEFEVTSRKAKMVNDAASLTA